jgi:hypothetical protein
MMPQLVPAQMFRSPYTTSPVAVANPFTRVDAPWVTSSAAPIVTPKPTETDKLLLEADSKFVKLMKENSNGTKTKLTPKLRRKRIFSDGPANLSNSTQLVVMTRNPLRSIIYFDKTALSPWAYEAVFNNLDGTVSTNYVLNNGWVGVLPIGYLQIDSASTSQPHGPVLYCGATDEDGSWIWMDTANILHIGFATLNAVAGISFIIDQWNGRNLGAIDDFVLDDGQPNYDFSAPASGYYRVRCINAGGIDGSDPPFNIALQQGEAAYCYHHLPIPGIAAKALSVQALRILAYSILYQNSAANIQKSGYLYGAQIPKSRNWMEFATQDPSTITELPQTATKLAETGMYGWCKPAQIEDFDLKTPFEFKNGALFSGMFPLQEESDFLLVRAEISIPEGRAGKFTFAYGLNFETTDTWFAVKQPTGSVGLYDKSLENLAKQPQWFENPTHISDILARIRSGLSSFLGGVQKYAPLAASAAEALAPLIM